MFDCRIVSRCTPKQKGAKIIGNNKFIKAIKGKAAAIGSSILPMTPKRESRKRIYCKEGK